MLNQPRRLLLVDQTLEILRSAISSGVWTERLPDEKSLCRELQVSRITLRRAVVVLAEEGWIAMGGRGRMHAVVKASLRGPRMNAGHIVRYLAALPFFRLGNISAEVYQCLSEHLAARGYRLEYEHRPGLFEHFQPRKMSALRNLPDTAGWVLLNATSEMQSWFEATGQPCVVTGSLHRSVSLPKVAFDFRAASRHAAYQFLSRGHRHVACLSPRLRTASQHDTVDEFLGVQASLAPGHRLTVIEHDGSVDGICRAVNSALLGTEVPTGILVMEGCHTLTLLSHLWRCGRSVPRHVSIISRAFEASLGHLFPSIATYDMDASRMARITAQLLLKHLETRVPVLKPHVIMPVFRPGESLAEVMSNAPKRRPAVLAFGKGAG
jgi:DNA-binding LacI/PurR family transcriptional regulator